LVVLSLILVVLVRVWCGGPGGGEVGKKDDKEMAESKDQHGEGQDRAPGNRIGEIGVPRRGQ